MESSVRFIIILFCSHYDLKPMSCRPYQQCLLCPKKIPAEFVVIFCGIFLVVLLLKSGATYLLSMASMGMYVCLYGCMYSVCMRVCMCMDS